LDDVLAHIGELILLTTRLRRKVDLDAAL